MAWNEAALRLLDLPADRHDGAERVAGAERSLGRALPAAVGEWFRTGADRWLARRSDNLIADLASLGDQDQARFLDAGLLLLETDSQRCCRWVTPLDGGDDPVVWLIDPDDFSGESRAPYADTFTAYTEADVFDALLFGADDACWSFDHELAAGATAKLDAMLGRRPTTVGWAHNQGCEAVHRFDGPARVAIAVTGTTAVWTVTSATELRTRIADILGVPLQDRS